MAGSAEFISTLKPNLTIKRGCLIALVFLFVLFSVDVSGAVPAEPEQTIDEFSLSGFGSKGKRTWEISGKSADIFSDIIKLDEFTGTIYDQEKITLTAGQGSFNKIQGNVHLEDSVVITTETGARLTTEYLDWDKAAAEVTTEALVDIEKDDIIASGTGAKGDTNLKTIDLNKDVKVEITETRNKINITCSGPLHIDYGHNIAVFKDNVFIDDGQTQLSADLMEVTFQNIEAEGPDDSLTGRMGRLSKIKHIVASGNVEIAQGDNTSFSDEAVYDGADRTVTLKGKPQLIIYSDEDLGSLRE